VERFAFDVLHHEIENAFFGFAEIGGGDNVRMLNRSGGSRLAFKTRNRFALLQIFARQQIRSDGFYGDFARAEIFICCNVNLPHRTAPQTAFETITSGEQRSSGQSLFGFGGMMLAEKNVIRVTSSAFRAFAHICSLFVVRRSLFAAEKQSTVNKSYELTKFTTNDERRTTNATKKRQKNARRVPHLGGLSQQEESKDFESCSRFYDSTFSPILR
jgi:hypothetical protein